MGVGVETIVWTKNEELFQATGSDDSSENEEASPLCGVVHHPFPPASMASETERRE